MNPAEFFKRWVEIRNDPYGHYEILDIKHMSDPLEPVIMSIGFRESYTKYLFMFLLHKVIIGLYIERNYSKLESGNGFLCLSQENEDGDVTQTTKSEREVLEHVRNSFWYLKNK